MPNDLPRWFPSDFQVDTSLIDALNGNVAIATKGKKDRKSRRSQSCYYCKEPATKSIVHAEGMAYVPVCPGHFDHAVSEIGKETVCVVHEIKTKDFSLGSPLATGLVPFDLVGPIETEDHDTTYEVTTLRKDVLPSHSNPEGVERIDKTSSVELAEPKVIVAGLAVRAEDTGRVLLVQRALTDTDEFDPAAGDFEFAGGHLEPGETPFDAARREWTEEIGCPLPVGRVVGMWEGSNGIYVGFVYSIASETFVDINLTYPRVTNPDVPLHAKPETAAWFEITQLPGMPALRSELKRDLPTVLAELRKPVRNDAGS